LFLPLFFCFLFFLITISFYLEKLLGLKKSRYRRSRAVVGLSPGMYKPFTTPTALLIEKNRSERLLDEDGTSVAPPHRLRSHIAAPPTEGLPSTRKRAENRTEATKESCESVSDESSEETTEKPDKTSSKATKESRESVSDERNEETTQEAVENRSTVHHQSRESVSDENNKESSNEESDETNEDGDEDDDGQGAQNASGYVFPPSPHRLCPPFILRGVFIVFYYYFYYCFYYCFYFYYFSIPVVSLRRLPFWLPFQPYDTHGNAYPSLRGVLAVFSDLQPYDTYDACSSL
jgi:hypothetical protein